MPRSPLDIIFAHHSLLRDKELKSSSAAEYGLYIGYERLSITRPHARLGIFFVSLSVRRCSMHDSGDKEQTDDQIE